jgi:hypothetical protein
MSSNEEYKFDGKVFYTKAAAQQYLDSKKEDKFSDRIFLYFVCSFIFIFLTSSFLSSRTVYSVDFKSIAIISLKYSVLTVLSVLFAKFVRSKFSRLKSNLTSPSSEEVSKAYEQALMELESGTFIKSTMAMAIEKSKGDSAKINSFYIGLRTKNLLS